MSSSSFVRTSACFCAIYPSLCSLFISESSDAQKSVTKDIQLWLAILPQEMHYSGTNMVQSILVGKHYHLVLYFKDEPYQPVL